MDIILDLATYGKFEGDVLIKEFCVITVRDRKPTGFKRGVVKPVYPWDQLPQEIQKEYALLYITYGLEYEDGNCKLQKVMETLHKYLLSAKTIYVRSQFVKKLLLGLVHDKRPLIIDLTVEGYKEDPKTPLRRCSHHVVPDFNSITVIDLLRNDPNAYRKFITEYSMIPKKLCVAKNTVSMADFVSTTIYNVRNKSILSRMFRSDPWDKFKNLIEKKHS